MKKRILLAFDGKNFSAGGFECIKTLNKLHPVQTTGVFLPLSDYSELLYSLGGMAGPLYIAEYEDQDAGAVDRNIKHFENLCSQNHIDYKVHVQSTEHVVSELKSESRFADLLIIGTEHFYENLGAHTQEDYIEKTLHKTECPVLLVPEKYHAPKSIIMAYDGSESSVFAIKQFYYLFPEYSELNTLLIYTNSDKHGVPNRDKIEELAQLHFPNLTISKLKLEKGQEFDNWLLSNKNPMLVTGAYGRSLFSEMLKESFIKDTIKQHKLPIFVTHK